MPVDHQSAATSGNDKMSERNLNSLRVLRDYTKSILPVNRSNSTREFDRFTQLNGNLKDLEAFCQGNRRSGSELHSESLLSFLFEEGRLPEDRLNAFAQSIEDSRNAIEETVANLANKEAELGRKYADNVAFRGRLARKIAADGIAACYQDLIDVAGETADKGSLPTVLDKALGVDVATSFVRAALSWLVHRLAHNGAEIIKEAGPFLPSVQTHHGLANDLLSCIEALLNAASAGKLAGPRSELIQTYLVSMEELVQEFRECVIVPLFTAATKETEDQARVEIEQLGHAFVELRRSAVELFVDFEASVLGMDGLENAQQRFQPSRHLVHLYLRCLAEQLEDEDIPAINNEELGSFQTRLSHDLEALMSDLAGRAKYKNQTEFVLTKSRQFRDDICWELADRLGVTPMQMQTVFRPLHAEMMRFAQALPRQRTWGKILFKDGNLTLVTSE